MAMRRGTLLVSDIDGTLVNSDDRLPNEFIRLLEEFRARGGLFTLATGRNLSMAKPVVEQIAVDLPVILNNGAVMYDTRHDMIVSQHTLSAADVDMLVSALHASEGEVVAFRADEVINHPHRQSQMHGISKVSFIGAAAPEIPRCLACRFSIVRSHQYCWDIGPRHVSKGSALSNLVRTHGMGMSDVVAVGDNENDIDMITRAGLGVAVANANPLLKRVATLRTTQECRYGVAELIEHLLYTPAAQVIACGA